MATPESPRALSLSTERLPLRLQLDHTFTPGPLDGAWWPQSRNLQTEASDLVDHFPYLVGQIERLLFSRPDWDAIRGVPSLHRIHAARGDVKVGSFPSDDTHLVILKMSSGHRLRLLVVPSETEPGLAASVMEQASDEHNTRTPSALLGLSSPDQGHLAHLAWNDDGPGAF